MSKGLSVFHNILLCIMFISIACNITFICTNICKSRQTRDASERLENELVDTASTITAASGTIKQVDTGLSNVSKQLNDSKSTASAITDSTRTSISYCGDIEQTICDLRAQIEGMEDYCNSVNSNCSDNNINSNEEVK